MVIRTLASAALVTLVACASTPAADDTGTSEGAISGGACQTPAEPDDNHSPAKAVRSWDSGDNNIWNDKDNSSTVDFDTDGKDRSVSEGAPDWMVVRFHDWNSGPMRLLKPEAYAMTTPYSPPTVRVCMFVQAGHSFDCEAGEPAEAEGMKGCCGAVDSVTYNHPASIVRLDLENALQDDTQDVFLRVESVAPGCQTYKFGYRGAGSLGH